jgi:hypothetical protein
MVLLIKFNISNFIILYTEESSRFEIHAYEIALSLYPNLLMCNKVDLIKLVFNSSMLCCY